ncbi:MAG: alkaline phosphatase [Methylococcaceae bacterium]|nr:alkaline phosphatase [Methylococcaceae bacterium]OYV21224.1 MAG: alkaline phosphatase [Methylococcaceae bacterium NSM2-1]
MKKFMAYCLISVALLSCTTLDTTRPTEAKVKNVIMIIGDGMGPQQVGLLLSYARQAPHGVIANRATALDRMMDPGRLGISMTYTANTLVTDSASSATQLATGKFAGAEMLGLDKDGNTQEKIIEKARRLGKATGLVSDTRITHATPAAFAAHQTYRSQENNIPEDLLATEVDVLLSGGLGYWIPEQASDKKSLIHQQLVQATGNSVEIKSSRKDTKNLLTIAQQKGYTLAFNNEQLQQANGKTLGLFANSGMQNGIIETQFKNDTKRVQPTLKDMSAQALKILARNERGFFLMIEAGQIDWASHRNDTGLLLHEMLRFNDTLNTVLDWAANRQDTLIIVTADHETGGFGFSYSAENIPKPHKLPGGAFADGTLFQPNFNFGNPEVLDKLYAQRLSYRDIFAQFDALPKQQQTPLKLAELVNRYTEFKITEVQAVKILATENNPFYKAGHVSLGEKTVSKMEVNGQFFVNQKENRENLLAQAVASSQQAVWATGAHTSTPVYVFVSGPERTMRPFAKILHHTQLGQLAIDALH